MSSGYALGKTPANTPTPLRVDADGYPVTRRWNPPIVVFDDDLANLQNGHIGTVKRIASAHFGKSQLRIYAYTTGGQPGVLSVPLLCDLWLGSQGASKILQGYELIPAGIQTWHVISAAPPTPNLDELPANPGYKELCIPQLLGFDEVKIVLNRGGASTTADSGAFKVEIAYD